MHIFTVISERFWFYHNFPFFPTSLFGGSHLNTIMHQGQKGIVHVDRARLFDLRPPMGLLFIPT
jgi:hypothetical protein